MPKWCLSTTKRQHRETEQVLQELGHDHVHIRMAPCNSNASQVMQKTVIVRWLECFARGISRGLPADACAIGHESSRGCLAVPLI